MIKEAIGTGDTILLAREAACKELGVETHEAEFEILQGPEKKMFGLFGGRLAKVRVFLTIKPIDIAVKYLTEILSLMNVHMEVTVNETEKGSEINLEGENAGALIGKRGETLDALQYLVCLAANRFEEDYSRVTVNIGDYRKKREKALEFLGRKLAIKAIKTGLKSHLEPMNPFERRIIHTSVQNVNGAISWSEGENSKRHVVIGPDPNVKRPYKPNNRFAGNNRDGKRPPQRPYNKNYQSGARPKFNNANDKPTPQPKPPINEAGDTGLYGKIK